MVRDVTSVMDISQAQAKFFMQLHTVPVTQCINPHPKTSSADNVNNYASIYNNFKSLQFDTSALHTLYTVSFRQRIPEQNQEA